ncbi:unnamed protein product [Amoebophrya sp. A25]|nr:unnamed protein product [Amoebophrya sp. A25]|eukprot:GSA25T00017611001.1
MDGKKYQKDRKLSRVSEVSTAEEQYLSRRGRRASRVKPLDNDEERSVVSASDASSRGDLEVVRQTASGARIFVNKDQHASSRDNSTAFPSSKGGSKETSPSLHSKHSVRVNFDASPMSSSYYLRSPKLREMQAEKLRREEEERVAAEEAERAKKGFSLKCSKSMTLDEPPDEDASWVLKTRYYIQCILAAQKFDAAIGFVILLNSITIGWESNCEIVGQDTQFFEDIEHIFLGIYSLELLARFYAFGFGCLKSGWVAFDAVLVVVGIASTWVLPSIFTETPEELGPLLVLRVLRLLRLARAVRLLVAFKTLWMLVRGLLSSAGTMCYTFVLIFLILYVSGVLAVELITKNKAQYRDDPEIYKIVEDHFSGLFVIMLTLVQFVTLDSIGVIYVPMIKHSPGLAVFFMGFILIVAVALMNLVTAVIVEGAIEQAKSDKEVQAAYEAQRLQRLLPELRIMFEALDEDGSGDISREELINGLASDPALKEELCGIMGSDDPIELFEMLDVDGGGEVSIDEFCEQILKTVTSDRPIELERIMKLVRDLPLMKKDLEIVAHALGQRTAAERLAAEEGWPDSRISDGEHLALVSPNPLMTRSPAPAVPGSGRKKKKISTVSSNAEKGRGSIGVGNEAIDAMNMRLTKIESAVQEILKKIDVSYIQMEYC